MARCKSLLSCVEMYRESVASKVAVMFWILLYGCPNIAFSGENEKQRTGMGIVVEDFNAL